MDVLCSGNQFGRDGDAARRFHLVAREHPDLDAGVAEEFEGWLHVFLEFVFDSSDAEQLEIALEMVFDHASHACISLA